MVNYEKYVDGNGNVFAKSTKIEEKLISKDTIIKQRDLLQSEINRLDSMLEVIK